MNQTGIPGPRSMTRGLPWLAACVTVGTVPYVVLKISWLVGGDIGLQDSALMHTTTYMVANSITLVLDLVVLALAWVLAVAARRRSLVVLAPLVWGATGLMVTPVLWRPCATSTCSQSCAPGSELGRWSAGVDTRCS
jgi:hypothetical protein